MERISAMINVRSGPGKLVVFLVLFCFTLTLAACVDTGPFVLQLDPSTEEAPEGAADGETPDAVGASEIDVARVETEEGEFAEGDVEAVDEAEVDVAPEAGAEASTEPVDLGESLIQASFLIDREVENLDNADIGDVDDFVVDLETGRIVYVVIDYGGALGIGEAEIPLPLDAVGWNPELEMTLTVEEAVLESAPALGEDWDDMLEAGWDADIVAYWQDLGLMEADAPASIPVSVEDMFSIHAGHSGGLIGVVEDVLLHLGEREARYIAIFADPGFRTPDEELIVPFTSLAAASVGDEVGYTVDVDASMLETAPLMDRELFLTVDIIDPVFADQLDAFWNDEAEME